MLTQKLPNAAATLITVTTTATLLSDLIATAASESVSLAGLDGIDLRPDGDIRFLADGNTPTATEGLLLNTFTSLRGVDLTKMMLISPSGNVSVELQVGKAQEGEADTKEPAGGGGGGSVSWGDITGTLSNQTDLQNALNAKANLPTRLNYNDADHFTTVLTNNSNWNFSGVALFSGAGPVGTQGLARFTVSASVGNITHLRKVNATLNVKVGNTAIEVQFTPVFNSSLTGSQLSTSAQEYRVFLGLANGLTFANPTDFIGFQYDRATDGDFWSIITRSGANQTKTVTTLAVAQDTIYDLRFVVNSAGTSVEFFNGSTSLGTIATHIPTSALTRTGLVERLVGAASRSFYVDYTHILLTS